MSNGEPPCDAACRAKLILDGDNIASLVENLCKAIEREDSADQSFKGGDKIIAIFNEMEDLACQAQAIFARGIGYDGPLPKMLS